MRQDEHEKALRKYSRWQKDFMKKPVLSEMQEMGIVRRVHRDRRRMPLEEILFLLAAVGVAVMAGWGVYLFG